MEYVNEVNINEAIIHILDNESDEPILNEYRLMLNDDTYSFFLRHIERCLKDEELKYAVFNQERNIVKESAQEYLNGHNDIVNVSKELARQMFILMKANGNIPSCDMAVVSISTEYGPMIAILKMDYVKNYAHTVEFIDNKVGINIVPESTGLPASAQKIQKCAFIKPVSEGQEFDLMVIDKQGRKNSDEYGSNYFISKYLGCSIINNKRDMTKAFVKATEEWTRTHLNDNADAAEQLRSTVKKKLKEEECIDVNDFSQDVFGEEQNVRNNFIQFVSESGIEDKVEVDKQWVEKKMKRVRLKIDKDIDLYIDAETYENKERIEIDRVGDGSINIIIKNVKNYIEK